MTIISVLVTICVMLALVGAIIWISKNGGWTDESQCLGNCSTCEKHCDHPSTEQTMDVPATDSHATDAEQNHAKNIDCK